MMMVIICRVTVGVRSQWQTLDLELTLLLEPSALALDAPGSVLHSLLQSPGSSPFSGGFVRSVCRRPFLQDLDRRDHCS